MSKKDGEATEVEETKEVITDDVDETTPESTDVDSESTEESILDETIPEEKEIDTNDSEGETDGLNKLDEETIPMIPSQMDEQDLSDLKELCGHNSGNELSDEQELKRKNLILLKTSIELKAIAQGDCMFKELAEVLLRQASCMYTDSKLEK